MSRRRSDGSWKQGECHAEIGVSLTPSRFRYWFFCHAAPGRNTGHRRHGEMPCCTSRIVNPVVTLLDCTSAVKTMPSTPIRGASASNPLLKCRIPDSKQRERRQNRKLPFPETCSEWQQRHQCTSDCQVRPTSGM